MAGLAEVNNAKAPATLYEQVSFMDGTRSSLFVEFSTFYIETR